MRSTTLVFVAVATALSSRAYGQDATPRLAHGLHLALEGGLLGYGRTRADRDDDDLDTESGVLALGYPLAVSARVGYLPRAQLEAGALFTLGYQAHARDDGATTDRFSAASQQVAAYARYVAPDAPLHWFAGAKLGGEFTRENDPGEDGQSDLVTKSRALLVGLEAGLYGFVAAHFSIDPVLAFSYRRGSLKLDNAFTRQDIDLAGWDLTLGIALSGWLFPGR